MNVYKSLISQTEQPPVFNSGHISGGKNTNLADMVNAILYIVGIGSARKLILTIQYSITLPFQTFLKRIKNGISGVWGGLRELIFLYLGLQITTKHQLIFKKQSLFGESRLSAEKIVQNDRHPNMICSMLFFFLCRSTKFLELMDNAEKSIEQVVTLPSSLDHS